MSTMNDAITLQIRALVQTAEGMPTPRRFVELLNELEASDARRDKGARGAVGANASSVALTQSHRGPIRQRAV